jgi:D-arabinose 1-dehydrogenase-like Zn-dependent alcohol dehydrogenase
LAEYYKAPLENVFPLNENILIKEMGYTYAELAYAFIYLVPFGGYADTNVKPGDVVLVAPATGEFGGAAVTLALALGATVIAAGRNEDILNRMVDIHGPSVGGRLSYVKLTGDADADSAAIKNATPNGRGIDVFIDFSPHRAANSTHIEAGYKALRTGGQISLMGGLFTGVTFPYSEMVFRSIKLKGKLMYEREEIVRLIALMEAGVVKVGKEAGVEMFGPYGLDKIEEALSVAEANGGWGPFVAIAPNRE